MGIGSLDLKILIRLRESGHIKNGARIIEMGAQQLSETFLNEKDELERIGRLFGAPMPPPFSSSLINPPKVALNPNAPAAHLFWKWLGLRYKSVDIDGSFDSIFLDLNYDQVPKSECGGYDLVTNYGTTEHVANQLNAFKIIHDLTAIGGVMLHTLPTQGMLNHGLVNYNPKFFWMLARSNGYTWLDINYYVEPRYQKLPQNIIDHVAQFNPHIQEKGKDYLAADSSIMVALQKVFDTPYVAPIDVNSGTKTSYKKLEERYWSVFKDDPFKEYAQ